MTYLRHSRTLLACIYTYIALALTHAKHIIQLWIVRRALPTRALCNVYDISYTHNPYSYNSICMIQNTFKRAHTHSHARQRGTHDQMADTTQPQAHQPNCITPAHIIFALTDSLTQLLSHRFFRSLPLACERAVVFVAVVVRFSALRSLARLLARADDLFHVRFVRFSVSVKIFLVFILADCNVCATCRDLCAPLKRPARPLPCIFVSNP